MINKEHINQQDKSLEGTLGRPDTDWREISPDVKVPMNPKMKLKELLSKTSENPIDPKDIVVRTYKKGEKHYKALEQVVTLDYLGGINEDIEETNAMFAAWKRGEDIGGVNLPNYQPGGFTAPTTDHNGDPIKPICRENFLAIINEAKRKRALEAAQGHSIGTHSDFKSENPGILRHNVAEGVTGQYQEKFDFTGHPIKGKTSQPHVNYDILGLPREKYAKNMGETHNLPLFDQDAYNMLHPKKKKK